MISAQLVLLRLEGRVYSATSGDLARALDRFCAGDQRAVLLDFSAVDYINGQGLSFLEATAVRLRAESRQTGGLRPLSGRRNGVRPVGGACPSHRRTFA